MKISIIVPCYNTYAYLGKCIESIIQQINKEWELILVNDGSTDGTVDIMRIYSEKDTRIKVINQKNQGLSVARNNGVKEATGDYILFLDSDDWYKNENCLDQIVKASNNGDADIIVFRFQYIFKSGYCKEDNLDYFSEMEGIYTGEEYLQRVLSEDAVYSWYPWRYAFRRKFWTQNQFQFRLRAFEDIDIIYSILLKARNIVVMNEFIYQYRMGREGTITQLSKRTMENRINVCHNTINTVNCMEINKELKVLLDDNFSHPYFEVLAEVNYLKGKDKKDIFILLSEKRSLMNYSIRKRKILIRKLIYFFGLHITAKLLFMYFRYVKKVNSRL